MVALRLYLVFAVLPYCALYLAGVDYATGWRALLVAVLTLAMAGEACWHALPGLMERRAMALWLIAPWSVLALWLVAGAPPGTIHEYAFEYRALTGACLVGALQAGLAAAYAGLWMRVQQHAVVVTLWLGIGVFANLRSTAIWPLPGAADADWQAAYAQWRLLNGMESAAHVGCAIAWWRIWR